MFKFVLFSSLMALAVAQYGQQDLYSDNEPAHGHHDNAQPTPYHYGFDIQGGDHHSDFKQTRQEKGDGHGNVQGSYSYTDSHGNQRTVNYVADHHGFRAQVKTNEPGTESQNPADVELHSSAPKYQAADYGHGPVYGNALY